MKWMPKQFTLPILIGFSLTGVGIALIYLLYKKDQDNENSEKGHIETWKQNQIELKVPRQFVPAVIGRAGLVIKDVQNKTGTRIYFKECNIEESDLTCIIRGNVEGIRLAEEMIKSIIENQPIIETYEMYVPQKACGRIIGRGGEVIKQIQTTSSAKIIVESACPSYDQNAERRIIIKGTAEQIADALSQIEDKVREEKEARKKLEASSSLRMPRGKLSPRNTAVNNTEQTQAAEPVSVTDVNGSMEVYVSAMAHPCVFWVQIVGSGTTALDKLVSEMTAYYNEEENREQHVLKNITEGQIVAARFTFDEQWYRAEVLMVNDDICQIFFVDYGDIEMVPVNSVLELRTDFLSLRWQAVECSLANVQPCEDGWTDEANDKFRDLTWLGQWKILTAKVRDYKMRILSDERPCRESSLIPCVDLYDTNDGKEINIGQELINEGLAKPEEPLSSAASSTLSLSMSNHDIPSVSRSTPVSPLPKRAPFPERSSNKLNSNNEISTNTPDKSDVGLATPKTAATRSKIEEIDLTTPGRPVRQAEEIDLVTPVKDETSRFIDNEKKLHRENGSGDYQRSGSTNQYSKSSNSSMKIDTSSRFAPAGYESDLSGDSDELELG